MKKMMILTGAVLALLISTSGVLAGINNTKHNLGSTGTQTNKTNGTGEICIFCHTPHGGDNTAPVPLWNKKLTTSTFSTYDQLGTSTLDAAVGAVGSVSLACLTCHDGTQAIDNIINAPGSGGYDPTGGGSTGLAWSWNVGASLDNNGAFNTGEIVNIGTDLTNDHPISMQYAGGGYSVTNQNAFGSTRDEDFAAATPIGSSGRWYVDNPIAGNAGSFDKWDFKLYTRDTTGFSDNPNNGAAFAGMKEPFVECGSCHDPHFETTTFLRMPGTVDNTTASNSGSQVCLTCHTK